MTNYETLVDESHLTEHNVHILHNKTTERKNIYTCTRKINIKICQKCKERNEPTHHKIEHFCTLCNRQAHNVCDLDRALLDLTTFKSLLTQQYEKQPSLTLPSNTDLLTRTIFSKNVVPLKPTV